MADGWGKVYVFNAIGERVEACFNDPFKNHFTALQDRLNAPYLPSSVVVPRGSEGDRPGFFWDSTSAVFQDLAGSWVANYDAIEVPTANDQNTPVSSADDLVLYVFREWVVLYDRHGFKLEATEASSYTETG